MNKRIVKLISVSIMVALVLLVTVVAANAQVCVMHPAGDLGPCVHTYWTVYGWRTLHANDLYPCTHFVPCY